MVCHDWCQVEYTEVLMLVMGDAIHCYTRIQACDTCTLQVPLDYLSILLGDWDAQTGH